MYSFTNSRLLGMDHSPRWKSQYQPVETKVPHDEDDFANKESLEEPIIPTQAKRVRLLSLTSICLLLLTIAAISTFIFFGPLRSHAPHHQKYKTHVSSNSKTNGLPHLCGNNSTEALALGCTFDQLTWAWLPKECSHFANDEFLVAEKEPWIFFEDPYGEKQVGPEAWAQVLDGELMTFGQRREHVSHCVYMFLSLGQLIRDKTPYHPKLVAYEHVHHCAMLLFDIVKKEDTWNDVQTSVGTVSFDQSCIEW